MITEIYIGLWNKSTMIVHNKKRVGIIVTLFVVLVAVLFYSYEFKLGYLQKATYLILILALAAISINIFNAEIWKEAQLFWASLLIMFSIALIDKTFHLHNILGLYLSLKNPANAGAMIEIFYTMAFVCIIAMFYQFLISEYYRKTDWVALFLFAFLLWITSIITDFLYHNSVEDYFQLFSLYFFASSFLLAHITRSIKHENSHLSSKS